MKQHIICALFLLVFGISSAFAQAGFPDDGASHPLPATGTYGYNTFIPGASYVDPVFGTTVLRVTNDHRPDDIYSHNKMWSADGTRYLHLDQIIDTATGVVEFTGIPLGTFSFDRGFDPVDPNVMYYQLGASLHKITFQTGSWTDSIYFTAPGNAQLLSLGGEGDWLDASGRYMVIRYGPEPSVYLYDRQHMKQGPYSNPINGSRYIDTGHAISITPDGKYLIGGGQPLPSQTQCATGNGWGNDAAFSWHVNRNRSVDAQPTEFWSLSGSHMYFLSTSDGRDYAVVSDYWTPDIWRADITNNALNQCANQQHSLPGNQRLLTNLSWNDARHIAAVARGAFQDFAFVSTEDVTDTFNSGSADANGNITPWRVYKQEIIAINILTGQIWRVAQHRSRSIASAYAYEPRLSASWGGEYIGWASNFNQAGIVDTFAVRFNPSTVLPAASTAASDDR